MGTLTSKETTAAGGVPSPPVLAAVCAPTRRRASIPPVKAHAALFILLALENIIASADFIHPSHPPLRRAFFFCQATFLDAYLGSLLTSGLAGDEVVSESTRIIVVAETVRAVNKKTCLRDPYKKMACELPT